MKNFGQFVLAIFAVLAVLGESKRIALVEVVIPFIAIIIFHHEPHLWLICLSMAAFLAVWNVTELITGLKEKLR